MVTIIENNVILNINTPIQFLTGEFGIIIPNPWTDLGKQLLGQSAFISYNESRGTITVPKIYVRNDNTIFTSDISLMINCRDIGMSLRPARRYDNAKRAFVDDELHETTIDGKRKLVHDVEIKLPSVVDNDYYIICNKILMAYDYVIACYLKNIDPCKVSVEDFVKDCGGSESIDYLKNFNYFDGFTDLSESLTELVVRELAFNHDGPSAQLLKSLRQAMQLVGRGNTKVDPRKSTMKFAFDSSNRHAICVDKRDETKSYQIRRCTMKFNISNTYHTILYIRKGRRETEKHAYTFEELKRVTQGWVNGILYIQPDIYFATHASGISLRLTMRVHATTKLTEAEITGRGIDQKRLLADMGDDNEYYENVNDI